MGDLQRGSAVFLLLGFPAFTDLCFPLHAADLL